MGNNLFNRKSDHNCQYNDGVGSEYSHNSSIGIPVVFRKRRPFYQRNSLNEVRETIQKFGQKQRNQRPVKRPRKRKTKAAKKKDLPGLPKNYTCSACLFRRQKLREKKDAKKGQKNKIKKENNSVVDANSQAEVITKKISELCNHEKSKYLCAYCRANCM